MNGCFVVFNVAFVAGCGGSLGFAFFLSLVLFSLVRGSLSLFFIGPELHFQFLDVVVRVSKDGQMSFSPPGVDNFGVLLGIFEKFVRIRNIGPCKKVLAVARQIGKEMMMMIVVAVVVVVVVVDVGGRSFRAALGSRHFSFSCGRLGEIRCRFRFGRCIVQKFIVRTISRAVHLVVFGSCCLESTLAAIEATPIHPRGNVWIRKDHDGRIIIIIITAGIVVADKVFVCTGITFDVICRLALVSNIV